MAPRRLDNQTAEQLAELANFTRAERARRGLSQRQASEQMGMPPSTLCRFERGQLPDVQHFLVILAWLDVPLAPLLGEQQAKTFDAYRRGWADCAASVRFALDFRQAPDE